MAMVLCREDTMGEWEYSYADLMENMLNFTTFMIHA